jgi:hypothetical protein
MEHVGSAEYCKRCEIATKAPTSDCNAASIKRSGFLCHEVQCLDLVLERRRSEISVNRSFPD